MRQAAFIRNLLFCLMMVICLTKISAKPSKVAIVLLADTTIVYQHVGLTILANFTDSLKLNVSIKDYLTQQLKDSLSKKYEVSIIDYLPDSVISRSEKLLNIFGMRKEVKKWLKNVKDKYDYVIFTSNVPIPGESRILVPNNTSGLYSRSGILGFYTTIIFLLYETENSHSLSDTYLGPDIISPLKDFVMPEDKRTFTPEMLAELKTGFLHYLNSRVDDFLYQTGLFP
jgi:hypothetical protein